MALFWPSKLWVGGSIPSGQAKKSNNINKVWMWRAVASIERPAERVTAAEEP
jgi:hypothetical protein